MHLPFLLAFAKNGTGGGTIMASRARNLELLAVFFVVLVRTFCAVPLAGQVVERVHDVGGLRGQSSVAASRQVPAQTSELQHVEAASAAGPSSAGVPESADAFVEQMSIAADVIFAGKVLAVRRPVGFAGSGQDAAEGVVEIDMEVDHSLRGPVSGSTYTLREWPGLWAGQAERYRVGQRFLLFLYPADAHGFSAPVHGAEGAVPIRGGGLAPGPDDASSEASEWLVDLRWIQTQVLRQRALKQLPSLYSRQPSPVHGITSEGTQSITQVAPGPLLVLAISQPQPQAGLAVKDTQPLSQVLALCREALRIDAMRRHDATP